MSLIEANWNPSHRQLRQFGVICAVALPTIGWLWSATPTLIGGLAIAGIAVAGLAFAVPKTISPLFVGLMLLTLPIGLVVGELALMLIYAGVFLPIGIVFKLMGRDRLQTRLNQDSNTYWQKKQQPKSVASYYRQS